MHNAPAGTPVTTTVAALSDHHLLQRIKELSAVEHHIEADRATGRRGEFPGRYADAAAGGGLPD